jgi:triphosphoribosyl-dephospho-CoA synthase
VKAPAEAGVAMQAVREVFLRACTLDVEVMKPGNVSLQSPGHGMSGAQFLASAAAAAPAICAQGATVGRRILGAVEATLAAVHCNTNLGIVLLCAPIAAAFERLEGGASEGGAARPQASDDGGTQGRLREALQERLAALGIDDSRQAFRAIALANPGGLGSVDDQDVHREPTVDLRAAMVLAADRDRIARQYANAYQDVFDTGLLNWNAAIAAHPTRATRTD